LAGPSRGGGLLDALEHGFTSVEADVWLVDGELRVAHDSWELAGAPTLEEAYLDPLAELVSPDGRQLHPGHDGGFQLLIDLKSAGPQTWAAGVDHINTDDLTGLREFLAGPASRHGGRGRVRASTVRHTRCRRGPR